MNSAIATRKEVNMAVKQPSLNIREEGARMGKEEAQKRADRIRAFREELRQLEQEQVIALSNDQRGSVAKHHDKLLAQLADVFDIDRTSAQKQLTLGLRIISFLGALAISAAVYFFFYRFWGVFTTVAQTVILIIVPIVCTLGVEIAVRTIGPQGSDSHAPFCYRCFN
jgi:hypothetical protein